MGQQGALYLAQACITAYLQRFMYVRPDRMPIEIFFQLTTVLIVAGPNVQHQVSYQHLNTL